MLGVGLEAGVCDNDENGDEESQEKIYEEGSQIVEERSDDDLPEAVGLPRLHCSLCE